VTKQGRLRWTPWPVEAGASRAVGCSGNAYIARPTGGGFALYFGGIHAANCSTVAEYQAAADRLETQRAMKGHGR
jgi:hypothetical protein